MMKSGITGKMHLSYSVILSVLGGLCVNLYAQIPPEPLIQRYVIATREGLRGIETRDGVAVAGLSPRFIPPENAGALVDFEVQGDWAYELFESGALVNLGKGPAPGELDLRVGKAIDLEIGPKNGPLYILDDAGGLSVLAGPAPPWFHDGLTNVDNPAALVVLKEGAYVLDAFGVVHSIGPVPKLVTPTLAEPEARDLALGTDGRLYRLDVDGAVDIISTDQPPQRVFESQGNRLRAAALAFAPGRNEPIVLFEDGRLANTELPVYRPAEIPAIGLTFLPSEGDPLPGFKRVETRILIDSPETPINLSSESFLLPVRILEAIDINWLKFRLRWDSRSLAFRESLYQSEDLVPADARIQTETSPVDRDTLWVQIVGGMAPEARTIEGTGTLILLELAPVAPADATLVLDELQWSSRHSTRLASFPGVATAEIRIANPPPYASLKVHRMPGLEGDGTTDHPYRVLVGSRLDMEIRVDSVKDLAGMTFDLTFDAECLSIVSLSEGELFAKIGPTASHLGRLDSMNRLGQGKNLAVTLLGETKGVRGGGVTARTVFIARTAGTAVIRMERVRGITADGRKMEIPVPGEDLHVEVR